MPDLPWDADQLGPEAATKAAIFARLRASMAPAPRRVCWRWPTALLAQ
ncbi:hypothetical protein [Hymenobacter nivis]|nr:hypothetical protein [Hymenobacter nivis]